MAFCSMRTCCGSREYFSINCWIGRGIVAEKKTVCRSLGVAWRISSMSSRKPMLSMTSTSSSMTIFNRVEPQRAAAHVVHDAAGRADDDLRALLQPAELAVVGLAAVDGQRMDAAS